MSPVNQLRIGIDRSTRSVTVGCGGSASDIGRSLALRTVGMCVMNSDSGSGCCGPRWWRVVCAGWLWWSAPDAVAELAVTVDPACESPSSVSAMLTRFPTAGDRGRENGRSVGSLGCCCCGWGWRKGAECEVVSERGAFEATRLAAGESLVMGISSAGPWPSYS